MPGMFLRIAWRNVFRNRRRSFVVITSVAIGMGGALFMNVFMMGMASQMTHAAINSYLGHVQVHKKGFADNPVVKNSMTNADSVENVLIGHADCLSGVTPRVIARGLAQSATNSSGVMILGVRANTEVELTSIGERVIEGRFLSGKTSRRRKEIVIGEDLARKLGVKIGRKMVLVSQAHGGDMGSAAFRVVGIFRMPSKDLNKMLVWINLKDAQRMLALGGGLSEFMLKVDEGENLDNVATELGTALGDGYEVRTWKQASREMVQMIELFDVSVYIMMLIIFVAAAFGIINTMLMSVFERMREFGILRAIGTSPWALFRTVVYEASFIGIIGMIGGMALMFLLNYGIFADGMDLSIFEESLALFGSDAVIKPVLDANLLIVTFVSVEILTIIASLWPAARAARLKPVEAMRHT